MNDLDFIEGLVGKSPREILENSLTEREREHLLGIKHELSSQIRWGRVTEESLQALQEFVDTLVFLEKEDRSPQVVKRNPYSSIFPKEKEYLNGPSPKAHQARKYVMLLLVKKLLGSIKTALRKDLESIRFLSDEEEIDLQDLLSEDPDEEEMDLVEETKEESSRPIVAQISMEDGKGCGHLKTTVRQKSASSTDSGLEELHFYCRDCRKIYRKDVLSSKHHQTSGNSLEQTARVGPCRHPSGIWKEGEEGKTALCGLCREPLENPDNIAWVAAGLEPYGDNPEEDEILVIPAQNKKETVA